MLLTEILKLIELLLFVLSTGCRINVVIVFKLSLVGNNTILLEDESKVIQVGIVVKEVELTCYWTV
jgi:hypothetical protein